MAFGKTTVSKLSSQKGYFGNHQFFQLQNKPTLRADFRIVMVPAGCICGSPSTWTGQSSLVVIFICNVRDKFCLPYETNLHFLLELF